MEVGSIKMTPRETKNKNLSSTVSINLPHSSRMSSLLTLSSPCTAKFTKIYNDQSITNLNSHSKAIFAQILTTIFNSSPMMFMRESLVKPLKIINLKHLIKSSYNQKPSNSFILHHQRWLPTAFHPLFLLSPFPFILPFSDLTVLRRHDTRRTRHKRRLMRLYCPRERNALPWEWLVVHLRSRVELLLRRRRVKYLSVLRIVLRWRVWLVWGIHRSLIKWIPTWRSLIKCRHLMSAHESMLLNRLNSMSLRNSFIFVPFPSNHHTFLIDFIIFLLWLRFKPRLWTYNLISILALILSTVIFLKLNQQLECLLDFFDFLHDLFLHFFWLFGEFVKSALESF